MSLQTQESLWSDTAIQCLIEILIDSQDGLVTVGERLQDHTIKCYFLDESLNRAQFIDQLESALRLRGVSRFRERGSTIATLHRTWARLRSRFMDGDLTLLIAAEQGENAVTDVYRKAIETYLPTAIRQILTAQKTHIELVHAFVKTERDRLAARNKTARSAVSASD